MTVIIAEETRPVLEYTFIIGPGCPVIVDVHPLADEEFVCTHAICAALIDRGVGHPSKLIALQVLKNRMNRFALGDTALQPPLGWAHALTTIALA